MMRIQHLLILALATIFAAPLSAQVTFDPFFAGPNDTITVYFDASQGNGELDGVSQVYAHTGVITDASTGPSDWKYVQGNWGQADPNVAMTNLGNNIHSIEIDIQNFYGIPAGEEALQLAFVFRNADGSLVGRASDGGDIFVPLFTGYGAQLINPTEDFFVIDTHITDTLVGLASAASDLNLFIDDSLVATGTGVTELEYVLNTVDFGAGKHHIIFEATDGSETIRDSSYYLFHTPPAVAAVPAGMKDGANYLNDSTVVLVFTCPIKEYAYVIGDHSNWELDGAFNMNRTPDSSAFWIEISGLDSGAIYRYQYAVGEELIRVADPYTRLVLDGWNDEDHEAAAAWNVFCYIATKKWIEEGKLPKELKFYKFKQNL